MPPVRTHDADDSESNPNSPPDDHPDDSAPDRLMTVAFAADSTYSPESPVASTSAVTLNAPTEIQLPSPTTQPRPSHSRRRDASYIPRPPNAFILFRSSFIRSQQVTGKVEGNHSNLSKIIGLYWKTLPQAERDEWEAKAVIAQAEHRKRYPDWRFRPGATTAAQLQFKDTTTPARRRRAQVTKELPRGDGGLSRPAGVVESSGSGEDVTSKGKKPAGKGKGKGKAKAASDVTEKLRADRKEGGGKSEDDQRFAKIADLLVEGKKGAELEVAVQEWERTRRTGRRRDTAKDVQSLPASSTLGDSRANIQPFAVTVFSSNPSSSNPHLTPSAPSAPASPLTPYVIEPVLQTGSPPAASSWSVVPDVRYPERATQHTSIPPPTEMPSRKRRSRSPNPVPSKRRRRSLDPVVRSPVHSHFRVIEPPLRRSAHHQHLVGTPSLPVDSYESNDPSNLAPGLPAIPLTQLYRRSESVPDPPLQHIPPLEGRHTPRPRIPVGVSIHLDNPQPRQDERRPTSASSRSRPLTWQEVENRRRHEIAHGSHAWWEDGSDEHDADMRDDNVEETELVREGSFDVVEEGEEHTHHAEGFHLVYPSSLPPAAGDHAPSWTTEPRDPSTNLTVDTTFDNNVPGDDALSTSINLVDPSSDVPHLSPQDVAVGGSFFASTPARLSPVTPLNLSSFSSLAGWDGEAKAPPPTQPEANFPTGGASSHLPSSRRPKFERGTWQADPWGHVQPLGLMGGGGEWRRMNGMGGWFNGRRDDHSPP